MSGHQPIDQQRDPVLGHLLREYLDPPDPLAFRWRVMRAVRQDQSSSSWDILSQWLRPGLAAAALLLVGMIFWFSRVSAPLDTLSLDEALRPSSEVAGLLSGPQPSSPDAMLAIVLGDPGQ
jgi:hypothetical protein